MLHEPLSVCDPETILSLSAGRKREREINLLFVNRGGGDACYGCSPASPDQ